MYLLYNQKTETVSSGFAKKKKKRKQNAIVYFMCKDFSKYKNPGSTKTIVDVAVKIMCSFSYF